MTLDEKLSENPLIEIDMKGLLTAIGCTAMVLLVLIILSSIEDDIFIKGIKLTEILILAGLSVRWWLSTAALQNKKEKFQNEFI